MLEQNVPVWFITGCSTGFGRELAKYVLDLGWCAVVTARDPRAIEDLTLGHADRALALKLDVTKEAEVAQAVSKAEAAFGKIDVLVNNAGFGYLAALEEGEDPEVRALFETNFFGVVSVTRSVLPGMRRRRHGHIINISSIGGFVGSAGSTYYAATKFAVEGLSEALADEVAPLGIKVTIIEPGPFRTDWAGRSLRQTSHAIDDYEQTAGLRRKGISKSGSNRPGDPVLAAKAIVKVTESAAPPLRLVLGRATLARARGKLEVLRQDFDTWEETSLSTDSPQGSVAK